MKIDEIDAELEKILSTCSQFAKEAQDAQAIRRYSPLIDEYGFLASIGSNLGKIKKLIRNGRS